MASRLSISVPLPLPLQFTLLPSYSSGKDLVPLLYVVLNRLPIFLTVSPTHQTHISLLPLLLSLTPPVSPLLLISRLPFPLTLLPPSQCAFLPFQDFWIPFYQARQVCRHLRIEPYFWDENHPSRGLLAETLEHAISWDEGDKIGHNWLPDKRNIPASQYSLASLLDIAFSGISIIPDDRCIITSIDFDRRIALIRDGEFGDPSRIRNGDWSKVWSSLISVTFSAWEEYSRFPSRPSALSTPPVLAGEKDPSILSRQISTLLPLLSLRNHVDNPLSFSPMTLDLQILLSTEDRPPTLSSIGSDILSFTLSHVPRFRNATIEQRGRGLRSRDNKTRERRARVMLGVVEVLNEVVLGKWEAESGSSRGNGRSEEGAGVIEMERGERRKPDKVKVTDDMKVPESDVPGQDDDGIDDLERRRGASPTPQRYNGRVDISHRSASFQESKHRRKRRASTESTSLTRSEMIDLGNDVEGEDASGSGVQAELSLLDWEKELVAPNVQGEGRKRGSRKRGVTLHSERTDGWNMYLSFLGVVILSYIWGLYT